MQFVLLIHGEFTPIKEKKKAPFRAFSSTVTIGVFDIYLLANLGMNVLEKMYILVRSRTRLPYLYI